MREETWPRRFRRVGQGRIHRLIGGMDYSADFIRVHQVGGLDGSYEVWNRPACTYYAGIGHRGYAPSERYVVRVEAVRQPAAAPYEVVTFIWNKEAGKQWRKVEAEAITLANQLASGEV